MNKSMRKINTSDGVCEAYVAFPEGKKDLPIVLFYMDAIGLRPRIYEMVDKIAEKGYYVLAPNIFYRSHTVPVVDYEALLKPEKFGELIKQVMAMAASLTPALSKSDAGAFLSFAKDQANTDGKAIGAVGYCMGGAQALRAAESFSSDFRSIATFHAGNLATDSETSPHLLFPKIQAELYIAHADHDKSMPATMIERVSAALDDAKVKFRAEIYKDAEHGWTMSDLPAYDAKAEQRHWDALFAIFDRTLKMS